MLHRLIIGRGLSRANIISHAQGGEGQGDGGQPVEKDFARKLSQYCALDRPSSCPSFLNAVLKRDVLSRFLLLCCLSSVYPSTCPSIRGKLNPSLHEFFICCTDRYVVKYEISIVKIIFSWDEDARIFRVSWDNENSWKKWRSRDCRGGHQFCGLSCLVQDVFFCVRASLSTIWKILK